MSILDAVAGGAVLGAPEYRNARCTETYEQLRTRILAGLLPPQIDFVEDNKHLILGFCAGFGAGKTRALCAKAIFLAMDNPGTVGAVFEPPTS